MNSQIKAMHKKLDQLQAKEPVERRIVVILPNGNEINNETPEPENYFGTEEKETKDSQQQV